MGLSFGVSNVSSNSKESRTAYTLINTQKITPAGFDMQVNVNRSVAYVSCGFSGIRTFNITVLQNWVLLDDLPSPTTIEGVTYAHQFTQWDQTLYIGDGVGGLRIINVSKPQNLTELAISKDYYGWDTQIDKENQICYLSCGSVNGASLICAYNISQPSKPQEISKIFLPGYGTDLLWADNLVYVTHGNGFSIINASDPKELTLIGVYNRQFPANGDILATSLAKYNDTVLISFWDAPTEWVNVSNPNSPELIDKLTPITKGFAVKIIKDQFFILDHEKSVCIYSINSSGNLFQTTNINTIANPSAICVVDKYTYILNQAGLLYIYTKSNHTLPDAQISAFLGEYLPLYFLIGVVFVFLQKSNKIREKSI